MRWDNFKNRVLKIVDSKVSFEIEVISVDEHVLTCIYNHKEYAIESISSTELIKFKDFVSQRVHVEVAKYRHNTNPLFKINKFFIKPISKEQEMNLKDVVITEESIQRLRIKVMTENQKIKKVYLHPDKPFLIVPFDDSNEIFFEWKRHYLMNKSVKCEGDGCSHCIDSEPVPVFSCYAITIDDGLCIITLTASNVRSLLKSMDASQFTSFLPNLETKKVIVISPIKNGSYWELNCEEAPLSESVEEELKKSRTIQRLKKAIN